MVDVDLSTPAEPEAEKTRLQSAFDDEIQRNRRRAENPRASNTIEYSEEFKDEVLAVVTGTLWEAWHDDLEGTDLTRADLAELVEFSASAGMMWVHDDMGWEFLAEDVESKVEQSEEFLE